MLGLLIWWFWLDNGIEQLQNPTCSLICVRTNILCSKCEFHHLNKCWTALQIHINCMLVSSILKYASFQFMLDGLYTFFCSISRHWLLASLRRTKKRMDVFQTRDWHSSNVYPQAIFTSGSRWQHVVVLDCFGILHIYLSLENIATLGLVSISLMPSRYCTHLIFYLHVLD